MKKLFSAFILIAAITLLSDAHAQIVKSETIKSTAGVAKTSLTGSNDTAIALSGVITASHKSVEIGATKTSGTVAGKVYFQGKMLDGSWVSLDSMSVANSAGLQSKLIAVPTVLTYADYRFYYLSTGGVWAPAAYSLRRN